MFNLVFNSFFNSRNICQTMMCRVLGGLLLLTGYYIGIYFLFQFLAPIIGYFESGCVITILLICTGMVLLFMKPKKENSTFQNIVGEVKDTIKKIEAENRSSPNLTKILLFSAIAGMGLGLLGNLKSYIKTQK